MPSSPMTQAWRNIAGPWSPSMCSLSRMPASILRRRRLSASRRLSHGIESVQERGARSSAASQCGAERVEVGDALLVADDSLAVERRRRRGERTYRLGDRWNPIGPIVTAAREDAHGSPSRRQMSRVLDLVNPAWAAGNRAGKRRRARAYEAGRKRSAKRQSCATTCRVDTVSRPGTRVGACTEN